MKKTQHILISGRVQGVNYRNYTKSCAEKMNLTGWVRNLRDGRVEALVQGNDESLEQLGKLLLQGPKLANVSGLESQFLQYQQVHVRFEIVADGEVSHVPRKK